MLRYRMDFKAAIRFHTFLMEKSRANGNEEAAKKYKRNVKQLKDKMLEYNKNNNGNHL